MAILIGIVLFVLAVGAAIFAVYQWTEDNRAASVVGWILAFALLVSFILVPFSMHSVDETEVLVIKQYGKVKRVAANTYIITPYSVDIMGDLIDELENNGLYI